MRGKRTFAQTYLSLHCPLVMRLATYFIVCLQTIDTSKRNVYQFDSGFQHWDPMGLTCIPIVGHIQHMRPTYSSSRSNKMQKILASSEPIFVLKPNGDENSSKFSRRFFKFPSRNEFNNDVSSGEYVTSILVVCYN